MTADFKSFAPSKDKTVTVTRKLTLAERKAEQAKSYSEYVTQQLVWILNDVSLKPITIVDHGYKYIFSFAGAGSETRVTLKCESKCGGYNARTMLADGDRKRFTALLAEDFNLCDMARLLKLANKQIADARSLKGNKPQPKQPVKQLPVKQKVVKKTELEMFAEEFKKLQAKYPDVTVGSNRNGYLMAYAPDTLNMFRTVSIML